MTELKPCFCCKCKPIGKRLRKNCYQVFCINPMCFSIKAVCAATEEQAIIAWNWSAKNDV